MYEYNIYILCLFYYQTFMNNIVLEKRQDILTNRNTAQEKLEYILDTLYKNQNIDHLEFKEPFHGNLDFSVLKKKGFHNVKCILFSDADKGEITSICNLPNSLEKLKINNQYLVELNDLPENLEELEFCDNYLTLMESYPPNLRIINACNNLLESLENLPSTLEKLYINNNNISRLSLKNNHALDVLHCSNNKTIIIDGIPHSVKDFKCENNPYIQGFDTFDIHGGNSSSKSKEDMDQLSSRISYYDAINEYMKLKNKYETNYANAKKNAYINAKTNGLGKRARANRVSAVLPKCVSCNRPVGCIFSSQKNNYTAICGDRSPDNDCKLNIKLYRGNSWATDTTVFELNQIIDETKESVIYTKLQTIFKYVSEDDSIENFNELMREYNDFKDFYKEMKETQSKKYNDPEREQRIKIKTEQIYKLISAIKTLIMQYDREGNPNILQTAVEMQVNELNPEIENLRKLKYEVMEMDGNKLVQRFSSNNIMSHYVQEPKVIKWSL
jgi:hypothetical protein